MSQSEHVSEEDLKAFIHGPDGKVDSRSIGEHVHGCQACREALEALTAQSAMWAKVPTHLKHATSNRSSGIDREVPRSYLPGNEPWSFEVTENEPGILLDSPKHPELLGRVGNYDIEREIGRGGMGIVYKAHDPELHRSVAIKFLAPHLANHGTARRRFAQEAIAAAGILHPNVIGIYGVNNEGKVPYIIMPLVDGPSLQSLVERDGPLSEIAIVRVALQVSSGLIAAHAQGLIHRDIKPANILIEGGIHRVLITDFGLARAEDDASLTRTGWLMGTPNYMSPEQTRGQRLDARSDLFSLGSLLYFSATGRLPFRAESSLGVLYRIQNEEPTPVRQVNSQISKTLADVITLLLKKEPEARFQSAVELHDLLQEYLAFLHQPDRSTPPRVRRSNTILSFDKKKVWAGVTLASLAIVLSFGSAYGFAVATNKGWRKQESANAIREASPQPISDLPNIAPNPSSSLFKINEEKADHAWPTDEKRIANDASTTISLADAENSNAALFNAKNEECRGRYAQAEELCQEALRLNPENDEAIAELGYAIHMQGRIDEAYPWHKRAASSKNAKALGHYNLACYYAIKERPEEAFDQLDQSIESDLVAHLQVHDVRNDPDLEILRRDARFDAAMEKMKQSCEEASDLENER